MAAKHRVSSPNGMSASNGIGCHSQRCPCAVLDAPFQVNGEAEARRSDLSKSTTWLLPLCQLVTGHERCASTTDSSRQSLGADFSAKALHQLNRQLSGMNRRTTNISLNAPSPLASVVNEGPIASTSALDPSSADPSAPSSPGLSPSTATTKRKSRTSRDPSTPKRSKSSGNSVVKIPELHAPPATRLSDLGGVDSCIESILELVALPLTHPEVYLHTGVRPPRGVLLVGPPGCGKTMLAGAIAGVRNESFDAHSELSPDERDRSWEFHSSPSQPLRSFRVCRANRKRHSGRRSKKLL